MSTHWAPATLGSATATIPVARAPETSSLAAPLPPRPPPGARRATWTCAVSGRSGAVGAVGGSSSVWRAIPETVPRTGPRPHPATYLENPRTMTSHLRVNPEPDHPHRRTPEPPDRLVEVLLPVGGHRASRAGSRLVERVVERPGQLRTHETPLLGEVPEPVLARLERPDHRVSRRLVVVGGVLARRRVAATDVSALGATPQVHPPPLCRKAFHTSVTTRADLRVDARLLLCHQPP